MLKERIWDKVKGEFVPTSGVAFMRGSTNHGQEATYDVPDH